MKMGSAKKSRELENNVVNDRARVLSFFLFFFFFLTVYWNKTEIMKELTRRHMTEGNKMKIINN